MITGQDTETLRALRGLADRDASVRLRAAMAVGSAPDPEFVGRLVERCAVESEFFVRDMLTWALTRHPAGVTVPALVREVRSGKAQARSQALHTLSKIGDRSAWPVITRELLTDADDEVARSAWRAAVVLVPDDGTGGGTGGGADDSTDDSTGGGSDDEKTALAAVLATQLGRGGRETQLSLGRALVELGDVVAPALRTAATSSDPDVRAHALATQQVLRDPDTGFGFAIEEAKRVVALGGAPVVDDEVC
ncbi:HEAT repeat domain-containing protein [Streptomyces endophyticus]|uniref:HEAT repeat domain-containing protein n=1 Tax=Streptomyces endophyticus TaxID=714166 RepID=A0ABU6F9G7_9ACTN|nr:HEAT repeat domain-containing protein [Streptomyces endophyticus]MEB8340671.1 HEAT repeat domain-containing protein [Streptomyces endophyticus]